MKNNLLKTALQTALWLGLALSYSAHAKIGSMTWFISPNTAIKKSITAISPSLSAKCATNVKDGQVIIIINQQKLTLTANKNSGSLPTIKGVAQPDGHFAYTYDIVWTVTSHQSGVFSLVCEGDNHLSY